jgi:predicted metal-dependent hydrolase
LKKFLRPTGPDPRQLTLQLDFFSDEIAAPPQPEAPPAPKAPPRSTPPGSDGKRRIDLGEHTLEYVLRRSKRRTIGFLIDEDGLRVSAPRWISIAEIDQAIRDKQRWIFSKLVERRERAGRRMRPPVAWRDGGELPFLGGAITLRLQSNQRTGIAFDGAARVLTVSLPPEAGEQQLKDRVQAWMQLEAKQLFGQRLPLYAEKLGVEFRSFALSSAKTLWGSCTANGDIRLNWRLIHFSLPLIDYVIAHELAHLREMNHSPRFWETLQSVFPEFREARKSLVETARETLPVF